MKVLTRLREKQLQVYGKYLAARAPRSEFDYATHVPYLTGIAQMVEVRRVVEFGCGEYSTLTFLDREVFPALERLDSFEDDPQWIEKVRVMMAGDKRMRLMLQKGPMSEAVPIVDFRDCDLVFIDDSLSVERRAATIRAVAQARPQMAVVVIHDFEIPAYRQAAKGFRHGVACHALNPAVGVAWNGAPVREGQIRRLARLVKSSSKTLKPMEAIRWAELFEKNMLKRPLKGTSCGF